MEDNSKGPTIKLVSANSINFLFFWVEWLDVTKLPAGSILGATGAANYQIGDYAVTDGIFFNPLASMTPVDTAWVKSEIVFAIHETSPSSRYPGSIGDAIYMSRAAGIFKADQTVTIDSSFYLNHYSYYKSQFDAYNTLVTAYNTLKDAYNTATVKEKARRSDFLKSWLTYALPVP